MNLYAIILGIIVVTLLGVSLARLGKVKTKADYLVAGRSLPAFVLVFTLLSSWIGSGSLLGGAENAYKHGFYALWQGGGGWAGLALIYFIAPRARKFAQFTIPDLLESRYNQTARVLGVMAVLFAYTAITSYQFIGGGDILHLIFPQVSAVEGACILAVFVIVFTAIAGMGSVAYMDVVIGLTGKALSYALKIPKMDKDTMLQLPLRGKIKNAKIDQAKAASRIASILAKYKAGSEGFMLGTVLDIANGKQPKVPPQTTSPLPWEGLLKEDTPDSSIEEASPDKKKHKHSSRDLEKSAMKILKNL